MEHKKLSEQVNKLQTFLRKQLTGKNKGTLLVVIGIIGMLLISFPGLTSYKKEAENLPKTAEDEETNYAAELSSQLEAILGRIDGVGEIEVMVTLRQDSSYVYATDLAQSDRQEEALTQQQIEEKHVIIEQGGEEQALVSTRIVPQAEGVIIVCEGGSDPVVIKKLTDAVTAALGIGSNRVAVSNMKYTE